MEKKPNQKLKRIAIILGICFVALAITTFVILQRRAQVNIDTTARNKIRKALLETGSTQAVRTVKSKYGFTLRYNTQTFTGSAHEVKKESNDKEYRASTYKDDELGKERGYNLVEVGFKDPGAKQPNEHSSGLRDIKPYLTVNTSRVKNYFDRSTMPDEYKDTKKYSDLDLMAEGQVRQLKKRNPSAVYSLSDFTIDDKKFKLIKETVSYNSGNATYEAGHQYTYMTVQHGRPYWMKITDFATSDDTTSTQYIAQLQGIIASITFQRPDESLLIDAQSHAKPADGLIEADPIPQAQVAIERTTPRAQLTQAPSGNIKDKDSINTVSELSPDSLVKVVARNQIATVRIGASRCASVRWTATNGAVLFLPKQCAAVVGSGSIITSDGHIVTNGHVVTIADTALSDMNTDEAWDAYYKFIVQAGYTTNAELDNLITKARGGDNNAAAVVRNFIKKAPTPVISNNHYNYIAQTSDDPIRVDIKTGEWQQTATNKAAQKIDSEVDSTKTVFDIKSPYTDVAILKIQGTYPTVELGNGSSVSASQQITAIGYPVVADDGGRNKTKTVPTVTQGTVVDIIRDAGNHRLFRMTTVIAGGNSGGPAFDRQGRQVGINTYGGSKCPDGDGSCFGRGVARDIEDAKAMAAKHNIRPSSGKLTDLWKSGLEDFSRGKYSVAKQKFAELNQLYPGNYAVTKMLAIASETKDDVVDPEPSRPERSPEHERDFDSSNLDDDRSTLTDIDAPLDGTNPGVVIAVSVVTFLVFIGFTGVIIAIFVSSSRAKPSYQNMARQSYGPHPPAQPPIMMPHSQQPPVMMPQPQPQQQQQPYQQMPPQPYQQPPTAVPPMPQQQIAPPQPQPPASQQQWPPQGQ